MKFALGIIYTNYYLLQHFHFLIFSFFHFKLLSLPRQSLKQNQYEEDFPGPCGPHRTLCLQ